MFGSTTLQAHIMRGLTGVAAIGAAVWLTQRGDTISMIGAALLVIVALVAWRGCPMCWLAGLFNTPRRIAGGKR